MQIGRLFLWKDRYDELQKKVNMYNIHSVTSLKPFMSFDVYFVFSGVVMGSFYLVVLIKSYDERAENFFTFTSKYTKSGYHRTEK